MQGSPEQAVSCGCSIWIVSLRRIYLGNRAAAATCITPDPRNLILSQLPEEQFRQMARLLVPVEMPQGMQLSTPNELVDHVYFPVSGLISVDALTNKGESVEVGVIGREGLAGVCAIIGQVQMGHSVIMQGSGSGFRIRSSAVREEFLKGWTLCRADPRLPVSADGTDEPVCAVQSAACCRCAVYRAGCFRQATVPSRKP